MQTEAMLTYSNIVKQSRSFRTPLFLARIFKYEYWPFWVLFFPAVFYWLWLSARSRSLTYFTAANPGIDLGGFFGESKSDILQNVPSKYRPGSLYFRGTVTAAEIISEMQKASISFPIICKPDKGEMGFHVCKIVSEQELHSYLLKQSQDLIVQEFITHPIELGILYYRLPDQSKSGITSIALKIFLSVVGDGKQTIEELLNQTTRGRFQILRLRQEKPVLMQMVPYENENILVEPIGNHCKGTEFVNGNYLITPALVKVFDEIISNVDGVYFGRLDLKVASLEDLYSGQNIAIMEINGTTSEPAHIYGKGMNLLKVYRDIFVNMKIVYSISKINKRRGIPFVPASEVLRISRAHFKSKKSNK